MQGGMDSYSFITHLTLGALVDERASLALFVPAFFAAVCGLLFGLRYAASIRVATTDARRPPAPVPAPPTVAERAANAAEARQNPATAQPISAPAAVAETPLWRDTTFLGTSL